MILFTEGEHPSDPCTQCARPIHDEDRVWMTRLGPVCHPCMTSAFTAAMRNLFVQHAAWLYQCGRSPFWPAARP